MTEKEEFYAKCAEMLGVENNYKPWVGRGPNRWNNRHAGGGRYSGFGVIRYYSSTCIHVCLTKANNVCSSVEEVYEVLRGIEK